LLRAVLLLALLRIGMLCLVVLPPEASALRRPSRLLSSGELL
jgi:hypothetical protein